MATEVGLPALVSVVVFIDRGKMPKEHEFVAVAAKTKINFRVRSQVLLQSREPRLGSFPRRERSVELIRAVRFVSVSESSRECPRVVSKLVCERRVTLR